MADSTAAPTDITQARRTRKRKLQGVDTDAPQKSDLAPEEPEDREAVERIAEAGDQARKQAAAGEPEAGDPGQPASGPEAAQATADDPGLGVHVEYPTDYGTDRKGELRNHTRARSLEKLASQMVATMPEFSHLRGFEIAVFWKREGGKSAGIPQITNQRVSSGLDRDLTKSDFTIWFAEDHCRAAGFQDAQFERYMFHALCHLGVKIDDRTEEETPSLRPHDFEGFAEEVARYGSYSTELATAKRMFEQAPLFSTREVSFRSKH